MTLEAKRLESAGGEIMNSRRTTAIVEAYKNKYRFEGKPCWDKYLSDQTTRLHTQRQVNDIPRLCLSELTEILRNLPEPSYQEVATTSFVADYLLGMGFKISKEDVPREFETEQIFTLGKRPNVYVRCDLDALTQADGKISHACGHSMNMTSVLLLAEKLVQEQLHNVGFVFQPAEEGPGNRIDGYIHPKGYGGGQYLRTKGIYQQIPALISCHVDTALRTGEVRISEGQGTAAAYRFEHISQGIVAHAALPWQGLNPIIESNRLLTNIIAINSIFSALNQQDPSQYALISPSHISTPEGELNSLAPYCTLKGVSRVSGLQALERFSSFMKEQRIKTELEAPPVYNDSELVQVAIATAKELGLSVVSTPARFRDETAWAGQIVTPWVENPSQYPAGCNSVLHFFVSGGDKCGHLHSPDFNPSIESVKWQVDMLFGIIKNMNFV